jgi:riboflavin kinase/FMN adenylyltransferase
MILLRDSSPIDPKLHGAVIAIGNFDGLHPGHQAVIGKAVFLAREAGKPAAVMTFEPHPRRVFTPEAPPLRILPLGLKLRLLRQMGLDYLRIVRFTRAFSATSAEDFVTRLLHDYLQVSHVVTGEDFVFGHGREGNAALLQTMAAKLGFAATACPQVAAGGERSSSTRIREALAAGDIGAVQLLLGRPYTLSGQVLHGDKRGRQLGFPTANLLPPPIFLPRFGIYAVRAQVLGRSVTGVASLGVRPDFPLQKPLLEVYLFDWQEEIYGERVEVELVHYLRGEQKFGDIEALKAQMAQDSEAAKVILSADA